ncbi:ComEC/Rec2 family competence protein [Flavobacterium sp.]|uniref:ComEC/Rec2 family competence protein n=1 Tax=Flavobacterium sp. TaxID=239 RepID=UPI003753C87A
MKLLQFPIVRIIFWFVLGIIFAFYSGVSLYFGSVFLICSIFIFGFCFYKSHQSFHQNLYFGISLYLLFFSIGIFASLINDDRLKSNHYANSESNFGINHPIEVVIHEKLKNSVSNYRYIAKVVEINHKISSGKILLNFKKTSNFKEFSVGAKLKIVDQLVKNFKPNNPNQFDYGRYLETKGVYGQVFTDASKVKIYPIVDTSIWVYASNFRNKIIDNLSKNGFKKEELAVVVALILGQQQDISKEILRDYQYAGAVHILSVSGLHVGFILLFITFLLKPLPKNEWGNLIRLIIVFIALWAFALIAGLAPSVVRSATMFSFLAVGMFLNRETNMFHTLLVSLFLILLFEPLFLFDIGFQLSYIALFFILWLQPMLKSVWSPKNIVIVYFWDILTVSIAAQIGAMPLSIYYFHQFPGLFFITNLVLIPCLSVVMALGVLMMVLAYFDVVWMILLKSVEISISVMNGFIKRIASIETLIIKDIPLSFSLLVVSYFIIFSLIVWFKKPAFNKLIILMIGFLCFQIIFFANRWSEEQKKELIVFNVKNNSIIAERNGSNITLFTSKKLLNDSFENKMIQSYVTANFCKIKTIDKLKNTLQFDHNKILIIDKSNIYKTSTKPDIIILRNSPKINLERLIFEIKPNCIIADASNYRNYVLAWKASCLKQKILFHSTYEKGFFSLK